MQDDKSPKTGQDQPQERPQEQAVDTGNQKDGEGEEE